MGSGPPEPQTPPEPDEWMRRLATLPLVYQPGERWLYNTGSDVLGVLIARAAGQPLDVFLASASSSRWGWSTPASPRRTLDRLGSCYSTDPETGMKAVYDAPDGQWATPPAFPSGAGGLVSTVDDIHAFGRMLLAGGRLPDGSSLLSTASVEAMTTDQIGIDRGALGTPHRTVPRGGDSASVSRCAAPASPAPSAATGWDGGLGSSWANDPAQRLVGVVLTTDMFTDAVPPPAAIRDFWTCAYAANAG